MRRDRVRFEQWLAEWKEHTWSHNDLRTWPRLEFTDADVHERTRSVLSAPSLDGLDMLATVVEAMRAQRGKQNSCQLGIGGEVLTLRDGGGTWQEIADWTTLDEKAVRGLARGASEVDVARIDNEVAGFIAPEPANPFFRVRELLTAARFFGAVATELDDVTDWLCFELASSGVGRTYIARHAHVSQLTLARRINRGKRKSSQGVQR